MTTKQRCVYTLTRTASLKKAKQFPVEEKFVFSAADGANSVDFYTSHINSQSILENIVSSLCACSGSGI